VKVQRVKASISGDHRYLHEKEEKEGGGTEREGLVVPRLGSGRSNSLTRLSSVEAVMSGRGE
jgi:hypothetical protein